MIACGKRNLEAMNIDHVHFYVEDAEAWRRWFVQVLGFQGCDRWSRWHTHTEVVKSGDIVVWLSAPLTPESVVAQYLQRHPAGVADVAFRVANLETALNRARAIGATILTPTDIPSQLLAVGAPNSSSAKLAQVQGWGDLKHTLIEASDRLYSLGAAAPSACKTPFKAIDHIVLNVGVGELEAALTYYEELFGFQRQQNFSIRTDRSALCSQVLAHPNSLVQLPINEPASPSSQIQEFLDLNRGPGIQHIALQTPEILHTIAELRQRGLSFLSVPSDYYHQLRQRAGFSLSDWEWQTVMAQELLVDWQPNNPEALLLQTFTQPIFRLPTFFFELIERRLYWTNNQYQPTQGFGEGNFQALFEAIEREQMKRGKLS
jgi:4-hydroxyphenylpyruvate dioxygenase